MVPPRRGRHGAGDEGDENMANAAKQFEVRYGDELVIANESDLERVCADMTRDRNPRHLRVVEVQLAPVAELVAPEVTAAQVDHVITMGRLQEQEALAAAAGFAPEPPIYALGTRVNETGVENARRSRIEHDEKPLIAKAMVDLRHQIDLENRRDRTVKLSDMRMSSLGDLLVQVPANGKPAHEMRVALAERAFGSLVSRAHIGGAEYLRSCWPELRAHNVNSWLARSAASDPEAALTFRVRSNPKVAAPSKREVFAVVSEKYQGGMSIDAIADAIGEFCPDGARGAVDYDGFRAKIECLWHSDVAEEEYCAGEMFKAGIVVRTDDTGSGSIQVSAVVWRNLCLNLMVIDEATVQVARIRHMGKLSSLAQRFYEAGATALNKLAGFRQAWGYAQQDVVTAGNEECAGLSVSKVLPGLFNGALERELVPVRGRRPEVLKALQLAYDREPVKHAQPTRSDMVNAFTRYAHETETDPFRAFEIEKAAGALLFGRAAKQRWPYEPISAE